jgi:uncharacterized protein (TIGR00730 family)
VGPGIERDMSGVRSLSLCVYCGSRDGADPLYGACATEVGTLIGRLGWQLVYGGGRAGLMGRVADAALAAGAKVIGVIPQTLMDKEVGHLELDELYVVDTMHQRKQMMAERSDAFVALPGGLGTFEELFEVWTWRQLGYHAKPLGLLNTAGYYDTLVRFIGQTLEQGFVSESQLDLLTVDTQAARLLQRLGSLAISERSDDGYRSI